MAEPIEQVLSRRDHFVMNAERNRWGNQRLTAGNPLSNGLESLQEVLLMRTLRDHAVIHPRDFRETHPNQED